VPLPEDLPPLATIIDLTPRPSGSASTESVERELIADARFLHGRYGDRWLELPEALGRPLLHAETLLAGGPVGIPPSTPPTEAIGRARLAARAATAMGEIACNESEVLEQALGARLVDLPLHRLSAVVDAVLGMSAAPRAEPAWASPVAARSAESVLDACDDEFRAGAHTHRQVYAQFTDAIWDVPARRLKNGRRPWRPISWVRLRRALAATSRTRLAPSSVSAAADLVLEARAVRERLLSVAPLLANHLGEYDRGPLTNIDAAREALAAVRRLQDALGDRLDASRLARLLAADAFKNDAVVEPARHLGSALWSWTADIGRLGGGQAVSMDGAEMIRWASLVREVMPAVEAAVAAVVTRGGPAQTLRDVVFDLLVRQRFSELTAGRPSAAVAAIAAGRAS
jgi:hypothetical protein